MLEREAPGIAEAVRRYGAENGVPTSVLSRGLAGTAGRTLIVNLPGSTGGVRDALAVLGPLLPHVVSQLRGGDHDAAGLRDGPRLVARALARPLAVRWSRRGASSVRTRQIRSWRV